MVEVGIIGSCVSRDPFDLVDLSPPSIAFYSARSSLGSAFSETPFPLTLPELDPDHSVASKWQRLMIEQDLTKKLPEIIRSAQSSVALVLDFVDERFDLLQMGNAFATYSADLRMKGAPHSRLGIPLIRSGSDRHFELWQVGLERLLKYAGSRQVMLNNVLWAHKTENGAITRSRDFVDLQNDALTRMYDHAREIGMTMLFEGDYHFVAAAEHRWGIAPFHFARSVYTDFLQRLQAKLDDQLRL